jgi:hypothetical protein
VSDAAPRQLTCPRCLARIDRGEAATNEPPRRVIPLDAQVRRDTKLAWVPLVLLVALVGVGIVLASRGHGGAGAGMIIIFVVLCALPGMVVMSIARARRRRAMLQSPPAIPKDAARVELPFGTSVTSKVLDYNRPRPGSGPGHPGSSLAAFASGFFLALLVCAGGFFLLAASASGSAKSGNALYLGLVVVAVIGTCIAGGFIGARWAGFGVGVATGIGLGMIALLPCGLCYIMTLS